MSVCTYAAYGGHLEMLQWERENGCPWDKETCAGAAMGGHLEIMKWARANGCPWDWKTSHGAKQGGHPYKVMSAAVLGRLDMIQWVVQNDVPNVKQQFGTRRWISRSPFG